MRYTGKEFGEYPSGNSKIISKAAYASISTDERKCFSSSSRKACIAYEVCQFFCVNGSGFVFGMGLQGKVPLPLPIAVEIAFMTLFSPGPASVPAREC